MVAKAGVFFARLCVKQRHRSKGSSVAVVKAPFVVCKAVAPAMAKCISRESNPGHIDGNDVFYH